MSRTQPILEQVAKLKPIPLSQLSQEELSRFQSIPLYMQVLKHNTENGKKAQANKNAKQVKTLGTDVAKEKKKISQSGDMSHPFLYLSKSLSGDGKILILGCDKISC